MIETLTTPEQFAQLLIDDIFPSTPLGATSLISQIADAIKKQCQAWENAVNDEEDAVQPNVLEIERPPTPPDSDDGGDIGPRRRSSAPTVPTAKTPSTEHEWRTLVKLDLQVGSIHLMDQFEWPLAPQSHPASIEHVPTPETFAQQICADLGIGGEFVSIIAHSIREQVCYARLNFDEAPKSHALDEPPIRVPDTDIDWNPIVEELSEQEIEQRIKEQERAAR